MRTALLVLGGIVGLAAAPWLGAWLLAVAARRYGRDEIIDTQIAAPCARFTGHDDALRVQSARRRSDADSRRKEAARIETRGREQAPSRIHLVGGGR